MYLSHLMIDIGDNPDRPRPGRAWLRNVYHVHQRLCMGFPTAGRKERDPEFLQPFDEADFPMLNKAKESAGDCRPSFLFRIDASVSDTAPRVMILVQSTEKPDWEYAFQNAPLLAAAPETREYNPAFETGNRLRFRVCMNLSRKAQTAKDGTFIGKRSERVDGAGRQKSQGKRVAVILDGDRDPEQTVREWFTGKAARAGFEVDVLRLQSLGWLIGKKPNNGTMKFRSALLEGTLVVTDAAAFSQTLAKGIGSAKAFGFGLLSVKPD